MEFAERAVNRKNSGRQCKLHGVLPSFGHNKLELLQESSEYV